MLRFTGVVSLLLSVAMLGCGGNGAQVGAANDSSDGATVAETPDGNVDGGDTATNPDPDFAALAGTWETVRMVSAGEETPPERLRKGMTVTFEDGKLITKRDGEVKATWAVTLDSSKSPKQMVINTADPGEKERLSHQIYKIEGDRLTTCSGGRDFPAEFTENTEKGCYLTVRKRVSP